MVCRSCGVIADVDCAVGVAPCLTVSDSYGFQLDGAEVIYWGRCPGCSTSETPEAIHDGGSVNPLPDEMLHLGNPHPLLRDTHAGPTPTPTPVEWVPTTTTTANIPVNTPLTPTGIGTGGVATNATSVALGEQLPHIPR
jgi:hypothetical protein